MKSVSLMWEYKPISSNKPVNLTIIIGDAQIGVSIVIVNDKLIIDNKSEIENINLGIGSDIAKIRICSTIRDVNIHTNSTSITCKFENDSKINMLSASQTAEKDYDSVYYDILISVIK